MREQILVAIVTATCLCPGLARAQGPVGGEASTGRPTDAQAPFGSAAPQEQVVPLRIRSETGPLQLSVSDVTGNPQVCTTPCQAAVHLGKVNLVLATSTSPTVVEVGRPSVVTLTGRSTAKLVGGIALSLVGAAAFGIAVSGTVGLLPAIGLGGGGGAAMATGGSLIGGSSSGVTVSEWE